MLLIEDQQRFTEHEIKTATALMRGAVAVAFSNTRSSIPRVVTARRAEPGPQMWFALSSVASAASAASVQPFVIDARRSGDVDSYDVRRISRIAARMNGPFPSVYARRSFAYAIARSRFTAS